MYKLTGVYYIMNGVCTLEGLDKCFEPYACSVCPYNLNDEVTARLEIGL